MCNPVNSSLVANPITPGALLKVTAQPQSGTTEAKSQVSPCGDISHQSGDL